jgi:adenine-specific DNA-methyltransferase
MFTEKIDLLMAYLLTDISQEIFNDEKREYGDGLDKFEPNDLNNAKVVNLDIINKEDEEKILRYYYTYRQKEINDENITEVKNKLNEIFYEVLQK